MVRQVDPLPQLAPRAPGAVQPHGVLLTLSEPAHEVLHVSANAADLLGIEAGRLLGRCFDELVTLDHRRRWLEALADPDLRRVSPVSCTLDAPCGRAVDGILHRSDTVLVVELEPGLEEPATDPRVFAELNIAVSRTRSTRSTAELCTLLVEEVQRLTGYDRVVVYRFDSPGHSARDGRVVAEARRGELASILGHRRIAPRAPLSWTHLVVDVAATPVEVVASESGSTRELDLSRAQLRSVSRGHAEHLRDEPVRGVLTLTLRGDDHAVIGLVECTHPTPRFVPYTTRMGCELLAQVLSQRLEALEESERQQHVLARKEAQSAIARALDRAPGVAEALEAEGASLLAAVGAEVFVGRSGGRTITVGTSDDPAAPDPAALSKLAEQAATGDRSRPGGMLVVPLDDEAGGYLAWWRSAWSPSDRDRPGRQPADPEPADPEPVDPEPVDPWSPAQAQAAEDLRQIVMAHQRRRAHHHLEFQAAHDALTGLLNRERLLVEVEQRLGDPTRTATCAVLVVDLDRFKIVNDSLGHVTGDALLRAAGDVLVGTARESDLVARTDGNTFVVACPAGGLAGATALGARIVERFRQPLDAGARGYTLTASVGIATGDSDAASLLLEAEAALHEAKRAGRNRFVVCDTHIRDVATRRAEINHGLRRALDNDELVVHYQPVFALPALRVAGIEALVRWQDPIRGLVLPGEFLAQAEMSGLVIALGAQVLDRAVTDVRRLRAAWPGAGPLVVSMNASPRQFADPGFVEMVAATLERHAAHPGDLCIEITERALATDPTGATATLHALRELGVGTAIDDFGTGSSSLVLLRDLPVDILKADRAFTPREGATGVDTKLVAAIVNLAHDLDLRAVAEGIETRAELAEVLALGCDFAQGHLLAQPVPFAGLDRILARREQLAALPARATAQPEVPPVA